MCVVVAGLILADGEDELSPRFMRWWLVFFLICYPLHESRAARALDDDGLYAKPYRPLDHLWYGTRDIPNKQNTIILGVGTAATIGSLFFDKSVQAHFAGNNRMGSLDKIGNNFLGTGIPGAAIGAGTLVFGLLSSRQHEIDAGEAHLEALFANFTYTSIFKYSIRQNRPDSNTKTSFPSGHTSTTFASAASLMNMYGIQAGVPALALAALTGVSRLSANAHYLSDIIFGATLGYVVGHAYSIHHNNKEKDSESTVSIIPYFDDRGHYGVVLGKKL